MRIAIVGAGPAGLTLARILYRHGISSIVFELEQDRHARTQGGTLDLHEGSAQQALKDAGLYDEFLRHARPEGEVLKIYDPYDQLLMDESRAGGVRRPDEFQGRPEIDRVLLRSMLLDSLPLDMVRWNHKLLRVERAIDETLSLHFADNVEHGFDLVVGADGAWSRVRPFLSDQLPLHSGITGLDLKISDAEVRHPDLAARVGEGMCLNLGCNRGILCQKNGDGCIRLYAFMRESATWHDDVGIDWTHGEQAKKEVIERYYGDWSQQAKDLVLKSDPEVIARPMWMLPIGFRWSPQPGVTMIADAAHLMSPFAGVGVNAGLEDSMHLASAIIDVANNKADTPTSLEETNHTTSGKKSLSTALAQYEEAMFQRAQKYAEQTWMYLNLFFHEHGGVAMCEHFAAARERDQMAAAPETCKDAGLVEMEQVA